MLSRKKDIYLGVALSIATMVLILYIGQTVGKRWQIDFTAENLYSLSDGTKAIIKKLNVPLHFKLYYSKTAANKGSEGIRAFNNYFFYVRDLLEEYASHSRNNIKLTVIDPRPDTVDEEDAIRAGLKKFPLTETEKYFFGLVVKNESGGEKVIEFFDPNKQENLEYDLTKLIYTVVHPQKKNVGILSSMEIVSKETSPYMAQMMRMQGKQAPESWPITKLMEEFYTIKSIKPDVEKITGIDILLIIHPKNFPEKVLYAIDQFLLGGGKIIVLVDPHAIIDQPKRSPMMGMAPPSSGSNLEPLLKTWGVAFKAGEFAGDKYLAGVGRTNRMTPPTRILPLLQCDQRCTENITDSIVVGLNKLNFIFPGVLAALDVNNKNITPLVTTTAKGNVYRAQGYEMNNPAALMQKFQEGTKPISIALKIVGKFKSAYPQGITVKEETTDGDKSKNKKKKAKERKLTGLSESKKDSAVIIFADVDFIHAQFAFRQSIFGLSVINDNSTLLLNSLENLTGSNDLMSIRAKGKFNRSFDVIDKIEFEAEKKTASKVASIQNSIKKYTSELGQLGREAKDGNMALLQNKGMKKKRELFKKIASLKGELRDVKRSGREKIEGIGKVLQYINTLAVPLLLLLLGLYINFMKRVRGKSNE